MPVDLFEDAGLVDPDATLFGALRPKIVDLFAGIGGTSHGVWMGLGQHPDVAINHWPYAIRMHQRNHPTTLHYLEDVWNVGPREAARGLPVRLLVGSPDCTDHSNAKGAAPRSTGRRALADVFVRWAREVRPSVIILENVREFVDWGPLTADGQRDPAHKGEEFRRWIRELEAEGYVVEWRVLNAADYGVPQARRRLFVVARCDGAPIVWPEPTHGPGRLPHVPAAAVIDWSRPTRSIFGRSKPLAENTLKRIAAGVVRYVINDPNPFLLQLSHGGRLYPLDRPLPTLTAKPKGGDVMLVAPSLIETGNGERQGQAPRTRDLRLPLGTITASGSQGALVSAFLAKHFTGVIGQDLHRPLGTVTARDHHSLVAAHLTKFYGTSTGADLRDPLPTITGGGGKGGGHAGLIAAFLTRYYTSGGNTAGLRQPLPTVTAREGLQLVTVNIDGSTYVIEDIGIRMLHSTELSLGQGFPADYHLEGSESDRIQGIGNSVAPQVMAALSRANVGAHRPN